jgi:hypothetical protein
MRTLDNSSPSLRIQLASSPAIGFRPGDAITGRIIRTEPTICARARLTVSLLGKSESKITKHGGLTRNTFVGRFHFFGAGGTTQVLFRDQPLEIPPASGGSSWDFALTMPAAMNTGSGGAAPQYSFLPLRPDTAPALPPAFHYRGFKRGAGRVIEASVQYALHAEIQLQGRRSTKMLETILPLPVEHLVQGPPSITDFHLKRHILSRTISSPRLVPGQEDTAPSLAQKTRKLIGSSTLPRLEFRAEVDVPTVLQLGNATAVPFRIRIRAVRPGTSDLLEHVPQQMRLTSVAVRLEPSVEVRCRIPIREAPFTAAASAPVVDLVIPDALGRAVNICCVAAGTREEDLPPPEDLGQLVGLSLGPSTLKEVRRRGTRLDPSFTTFNIKHTYRLAWELGGEMAGEKFTLGASREVIVRPAELSTEGEQPAEMPLSVRLPAELSASAERPAGLSSAERPAELLSER